MRKILTAVLLSAAFLGAGILSADAYHGYGRHHGYYHDYGCGYDYGYGCGYRDRANYGPGCGRYADSTAARRGDGTCYYHGANCAYGPNCPYRDSLPDTDNNQ